MSIISLALLIVDDKILMFRRAQSKGDQFSGKFGLPGGHVKENENTLEGAKRETMEETGLRLINPIYVNSYKFDDNRIYLYAEELKNTNGIRLNHEHTEYKLFDPEELETDSSVIPTTKFMYNDYLNKRGVKLPEKQVANEDLEYEHVDDASPEKNNYKIGQKLSLLNIAMDEGKLIHHVWNKIHDNKLKHAKCERCRCEKYYDDRFGKVIFVDRHGKTHHGTPECVLPNTKL